MRKLENPNPNSEKYKAQKAGTILNAKEFDKEKKKRIITFESDVSPLPKQYP